jgi:phage terminase large subunit-like protein
MTISDKWRTRFKLIPGYDPVASAGEGERFDEQAADDAIEFVETCCHHVEGRWAGQLLRLEEWQRALFGCLFGWKRADGSRRYREALIFLPRKNSKTTMGSAIVCVVAYTDNEPGAKLYSTAAEREQARICFEITAGMIRLEPDMLSRAEIFKYSVVFHGGAGSYKALSAEAGHKHGLNPHLVINDELHVHPTKDLTVAMGSGMGARRQPLLIHLTTSDFERPGSICNEMHDYASKVRDGIIVDSSFLPIIYEASRDDDWTDAATWYKANPNLGISVSRDFIARKCQRAQDTPAEENEFKRLHLNIRTEQAVRWLPMEKWDACEVVCDDEELLGKPCMGGLDLAATSDITALVLLFDLDNGVRRLLCFFWVPEAQLLNPRNPNREAYQEWAKAGVLRTTPEDMIDYGFVRRDINQIGEQYKIIDLAIDRLFQGAQLANELDEKDGFEVTGFGQGFMSMAAPTLELERLILSGKLDHGGNPVLRWMAANVAVKYDEAGNMKPNKAKSSGKIDGIVCAIMALGRAMVQEEPGESIYETQGITFV